MPDSNWAWLPDDTGTHAAEIEEHYRNIAPAQWPKGLYRLDSNAVADQTAIGALFGAVRKMSWWVMDNYLPQRDTGAYLLHLWEDLFGLDHGGTASTRINRIVAFFRNRGTLFTEKIQAIFGPLFDADDPQTDISITGPTPSQAWQASVGFSRIKWPLDPALDINHIHGASYAWVWGVGNTGATWRYSPTVNGTMWSVVAQGITANNLLGVWAPVGDTQFAWAVGDGGAVIEWLPSAWSAGPVGGPVDNLKAVSGTQYRRYSSAHSKYIPHTLAVCGANGRISRWDGSWTNTVVGGGGDTWQTIHAYSPDEIWAAADTGKVAVWDGTSWSTSTPAAVSWTGIRRCQDNGYVYVVGASGNCYELPPGGSWSLVSTGHAVNMNGLSGWASDRLIAVGNNGQAWRYSGPAEDTWREIHTPCWENLNSVWCSKRTGYVFAGGNNGQTMMTGFDGGEGLARNQSTQHIYSTALDLDPDYPAARSAARLCAPFYQRWSVGRRKTLRWSDSGGQSGWNNSCWS